MSVNKSLPVIEPYITQTRIVTGFTAIDLRMNGNVYYKQGSNWSMKVSAQQNILDKLETFVGGSSLIIKYNDRKIYALDKNIRIDITAPVINSFIVNSSGNITCLSNIETAYLFLTSRGSGNILMKTVETGIITALSSKSGTISATGGSVLAANLKTIRSGKIDLSGIAARSVIAQISGSGKIHVSATDNLRATIEGSGSIYFSGYPTVCSKISGTGQLVHSEKKTKKQ